MKRLSAGEKFELANAVLKQRGREKEMVMTLEIPELHGFSGRICKNVAENIRDGCIINPAPICGLGLCQSSER